MSGQVLIICYVLVLSLRLILFMISFSTYPLPHLKVGMKKRQYHYQFWIAWNDLYLVECEKTSTVNFSYIEQGTIYERSKFRYFIPHKICVLNFLENKQWSSNFRYIHILGLKLNCLTESFQIQIIAYMQRLEKWDSNRSWWWLVILIQICEMISK